ncbi:enoyl-CoA hydratase-related protein [Allopusillimonas ginsengisoli]|uniref:enoyl-CoA hydratase-related protein n=1 Tax=Allopusillimonas ginsengisoli TaxID=453575 RepID=UPI00101F64C1|nr:enoyl-CoA hydratase-related protein [Allopusillimonas ginsengisoli]TEA78757.1 enoyl-CoA hydratase [Allopusillimonas ginsengisoli]
MKSTGGTAARTPLIVSQYGLIDRLLVDSPANRNALSICLMEAIIDAIERSAQRCARMLVIDHTGDVFSAGVDLKERLALKNQPQRHSALLGQLLATLWAYPAPVICRVAGRVRGGGIGLIACSDIVVCSSGADFAFSEVRVGVAPALVGSFSLAGLSSRALKPWLLSGESFGAEEALRLGLVTRIATDPTTDIGPEMKAVLKGAPGGQRATKSLVRELARESPLQEITAMQRLSAELFATVEAMEGMAAFGEKRAPTWVAEGEADLHLLLD